MKTLEFSYQSMKNSFEKGRLLNLLKLKFHEKNSFLEIIDNIEIENKYNLKDSTKEELYKLKHKLELGLFESNKTAPVGRINKFDFNKMIETMHNMYGQTSNNVQVKYAELYDYTQTRILTDYVGIIQLRTLFSPNYLFIEWLMHMEWLDKGNMKSEWNYYRDHWIHQIRDMYSSIELLYKEIAVEGSGEKNLSDVIINHIKNRNTDIDKYIYHKAEEEKNRIENTKKLFPLYKITKKSSEIVPGLFIDKNDADICNLLKEYLKKINCDEEQIKNIYNDLGDYNDNIQNFIIRYISNSAIFLAGIFHDIGYPIQFTREHRFSLQDAIINASIFGIASARFSDFIIKLSTSMLFQIIDHNDIKTRFEKSDHGVLSALTLLMFVYDNGLFYRLNPAQQAAIELAALITYDHTTIYSQTASSKEQREKMIAKQGAVKYTMPVNTRNPLSYLFRFCDDIQEWDRMYFRIDKNNHLVFCSVCKMPIAETTENKKNKYFCKCSAQNNSSGLGIIPVSENYEIFHRNLNHIYACNDVTFYPIVSEDNEIENYNFLPIGQINKNIPLRDSGHKYGSFILNIDYNHWQMLQLSLCEPSFGEHGAREINKIRRFLTSQDKFPKILIYSIPTQNPVTLKVCIIEKYLNWFMQKLNWYDPPPRNNFINSLIESLKDIESLPYGDLEKNLLYQKIDQDFDYYNNIIENAFTDIINFQSFAPYVQFLNKISKNIKMYIKLLFVARYYGKWLIDIKIKDKDLDMVTDTILQKHIFNDNIVKKFKEKTRSHSLEKLIINFLKNELLHLDYYKYASSVLNLPDKYYKIYEEQSYSLKDVIKEYTYTNYYKISDDNENDFLDMHRDLYFFYLLEKEMNKTIIKYEIYCDVSSELEKNYFYIMNANGTPSDVDKYTEIFDKTENLNGIYEENETNYPQLHVNSSYSFIGWFDKESDDDYSDKKPVSLNIRFVPQNKKTDSCYVAYFKKII